MDLIKKYSIFLIAVFIIILAFLWDKELGSNAIETVKFSTVEMLLVLPPVFILLGLLDVWVPRDTMVKYMGENSGFKGALLAFIIGSSAAGPLYVVFPIAAAFMKKDVRFYNILILIGAWSTTKIPMLLFEFSALGGQFMFTRLLMNIPIVIIMALVMDKAFKQNQVEAIYNLAKSN
ncbi:MAG: permease [Bacillota bacterium]